MLHPHNAPPAGEATVNVGVLHNMMPDGSGFLGHQPEHPMRVVYSCLADASQSDDETLEQAFFAFNVGDDPLFGEPLAVAVEYRAKRNRSLSVGDVVAVDRRLYACASFGWSRVMRDGNGITT